MFEPPNPQKLVGLWVRVGAGQDGCMVDPEDPGKCPWVRTLFLGVVNKNVLFIEGDVDDILTLLKVVGGEVDPHDRVLVEDTVSNDEVLITVTIVGWVRFEQAGMEMLFEMWEEVLQCLVSTLGRLLLPLK